MRSSCRPSFSCLLICLISLFVVIALLRLCSSPSFDSVTSGESYTRLKEKEQAVSDYLELRDISLGVTELSFCGKEKENYVPCYNVSENLVAGLNDGEEFDRHCDLSQEQQHCLVRPPKDYKTPLNWPAGRDIIWSGNLKITKDQFLSSGSMTKRLMLLEENQIAFRSDDGLFFDGVKDYSRQVAKMIGLGSESEFHQVGVRTILDIDCGFGSFGAHLLSLNLMPVCMSAFESTGSQVQLALERGLPAIIGNFISRQLPFPSLSYDIIHCAQCGISWDDKDGMLLIEVDRILKPGGYFVLTSPTSRLGAKKGSKLILIEEFANKICWNLLAQQEETAIWQKTMDIQCYTSSKHGILPLCTEKQDVQRYYHPLVSCISGTTNRRWVPIQNRTSSSKLTSSELEFHGVHPVEFYEDLEFWRSALRNYWSLLSPLIFSDHPKRPGEEDPLAPNNMIRNVMDMNAHYGGLNSAFLESRKSVWVMNVVPIWARNTLPLVLDQGFAGVLHDWCEPFPSYPRTYDMIHANGLLSYFTLEGCSITALFLEMDRILRPEGWVVICDNLENIEKARMVATQMRWEARILDLQNGSDQRLLICRKPFLRK